jgi:imidazolonepropionase
MSQLTIYNIGRLCGVRNDHRGPVKGAEMADFPGIDHAFVRVANGRIADFGPMPEGFSPQGPSHDARGGWLFPTWCDSHTHIVYAEPRETEFVMKIKGMGYEEIARAGGGILNSARRLRETPEEVLYERAHERLWEMIRSGTGALEIKSGYGLDLEAEMKMLRVVRRLKATSLIPIKATFLGAHAFPEAFREDRDGYVRTLVEEMIPRIAGEGLADFVDVFCDRGFFTPEQTERILEAGWRYGLPPKIHANELDFSGGVQVGVKHRALSVDHLECVGEAEIAALKESSTMPTLLPSTAFFLRLEYAPARKMIDAGLPVALATDYNPGSSPSGRMPFVVSLACIQMRMLPEEALNAATRNGAVAMGLEDEVGAIQVGLRGNFFLTDALPSLAFLPYAFGSDWVRTVVLDGKIQQVK